MVLSDLTANLTEWFIVKEIVKEEVKETIKNEVKETIKEEIKESKKEEIYIILINGKPYGYYYDEDETEEQLEQTQEYVLNKHLCFDRCYFWVHIKDKDCIVKTKLISSIIGSFDRVEEYIEIIKSTLLPKVL